MRPHSHFDVSVERPRARGVCDRCGQIWNLDTLRWQYQWVGPRLQNIRRLVCEPCYDVPQPNLRTIKIPPDPIPVMNARPENYLSDDNPLSGIMADANFFTPQYGSRIGSLTGGGGLNSAFDSVVNKQAWMSACNKTVSDSSYNNYVGVNWTGNVANLSMPSSMLPPFIQHSLTSVSVYAPSDKSFLGTVSTPYVLQYSPVGLDLFGTWTTIASGNTAGTAGEVLTIVPPFTTNPLSQFHRIAFLGDGVNYVSVAQVQFSVAERGGNYSGV